MRSDYLSNLVVNMPTSYGENVGVFSEIRKVIKVRNVDSFGLLHRDFEDRSFNPKEVNNLVVQENDLLVVKSSGSKANILSGKAALCSKENSNKIVASNFLLRLQPKADRILPKYLWYYLNSPFVKNFIRTIVGTTTYPNIKWSSYSNLKVPLPEIAVQKMIVRILDMAYTLNQKDKEISESYDQLSLSLFYDMFGDPFSNPKKWPRTTLGEVCLSVKDGPHVSPKYSASGIPFISVNNIIDGKIDVLNAKYITEEDFQIYSKKGKPEHGDILYTKGGTTGFAKRVDVTFDFMNWVHIAVLKIKKTIINDVFFEYMLNTPYCYTQSQKYTRGIANRDLVLGQMKKIELFLPPIELQEKFSLRIIGVEKQRNNIISAKSMSDLLFQSLLQRAFTGKLVKDT